MAYLSLVTVHRHRLVYVAVPKNASRSMYQLMVHLAGVPSDYPDPFGRFPRGLNPELSRYGLTEKFMGRDDAVRYQESLGGYTWFAVTRDPYRRSASAYFDKLNRYARVYARGPHLWSKFRTFAGPMQNWGDTARANAYLRRSLSFEDFLQGLQTHGTDIDPHFATQHHLLGEGAVHIDHIYPLSELSELMSTLGHLVGQSELERFAEKKVNVGRNPEKYANLMTDTACQLIDSLYQEDFTHLGFARRKPV